MVRLVKLTPLSASNKKARNTPAEYAGIIAVKRVYLSVRYDPKHGLEK
jgi:hypothetical protein